MDKFRKSSNSENDGLICILFQLVEGEFEMHMPEITSKIREKYPDSVYHQKLKGVSNGTKCELFFDNLEKVIKISVKAEEEGQAQKDILEIFNKYKIKPAEYPLIYRFN